MYSDGVAMGQSVIMVVVILISIILKTIGTLEKKNNKHTIPDFHFTRDVGKLPTENRSR